MVDEERIASSSDEEDARVQRASLGPTSALSTKEHSSEVAQSERERGDAFRVVQLPLLLLDTVRCVVGEPDSVCEYTNDRI